MAALPIALGAADRLQQLYAYPNRPGSTASLAETILHWFKQTLSRDGLAAQGASATVRVEGTNYYLDLDGPSALAQAFSLYGERLPRLLENGWNALTEVIPQIRADGKWDPENVGWRFFLPFGLAMVRQRSLQFFHYPPIRLLDTMQDYLNDPVPVRWAELLQANGVVSEQDAWLYETVVDATPIAAPDDQGTKGLIPIQYFHEYQKAQVQLLLNTSPANAAFTIPVVVYGGPARATFAQLYNVKLGVNVAATAEVLPGKKTAVLGANHPYRFYAQAQIDGTPDAQVGSGRIVPKNCREAAEVMVQDLIVARWQCKMVEDPSQDPQTVLADCARYWQDPAHAAAVCALVQHEGSLLYPDPNSLEFTFRLTLPQAMNLCGQHGNDPCAAGALPA